MNTGKLGPAGGKMSSDVAVVRLEAYERATRAAGGPTNSPILRLSNEQLAALFAPHQLDSLVIRPFRRSVVECPANDGARG